MGHYPSRSSPTDSAEDPEFLTYSFDGPKSAQQSPIRLAIAQYQNYAVLSLDTMLDRDRVMGLILGIDKPEKSVSGDRRLEKLQEKYKLLPVSLGYVNHREIINGLTQADANEFGRMLDAIVASRPHSGAQTDPFASIRTAACRKELMAIAGNWPQTVLGYTQLDLSDKQSKFGMRMVMESNDAPLLRDLRTLRGHIPVHLTGGDSAAKAGVALGLNIDAVVPFVSKMLAALSQKKYQCESLQRMQRKMTEANPSAALVAATGMLSGMRGISFALLSMKLGAGSAGGSWEELDGIITLSAENPQSLLTSLRNMPSSPIAELEIPSDGSAVALPVSPMMPAGVMPKVAIKGKHIVFYFGPQAEAVANRLAQGDAAANGLFSLAVDYGAFFALLSPANLHSLRPRDQAQLNVIKNLNMKLQMMTDFTESGIELDSNMTMQQPRVQ